MTMKDEGNIYTVSILSHQRNIQVEISERVCIFNQFSKNVIRSTYVLQRDQQIALEIPKG